MRSGMTCPFCQGRGWSWRGEGDGEAFRQACEPCEGRGHGRVDVLMMVLPWLLAVVVWAGVIGMVWWAWGEYVLLTQARLP